MTQSYGQIISEHNEECEGGQQECNQMPSNTIEGISEQALSSASGGVDVPSGHTSKILWRTAVGIGIGIFTGSTTYAQSK